MDRTITHLGAQCGFAAPRQANSSITPDPCRDAHNAFRHNTQAQTTGGCTYLQNTCSHLPSAYTPKPIHQRTQPHGATTSSCHTHRPTQHALPHEYTHECVQADRPLPMTPFSCSGAGDWPAHSSEPTQEPWGREVSMSFWHS